MEFFGTYINESVIFIGAIFLYVAVSCGIINTRKDKANIVVGGIAGEEEWSEFQEITIGRQTNIDSALHRIEIGIGAIVLLLAFFGYKLIN
jgi:hypothetical protein